MQIISNALPTNARQIRMILTQSKPPDQAPPHEARPEEAPTVEAPPEPAAGLGAQQGADVIFCSKQYDLA